MMLGCRSPAAPEDPAPHSRAADAASASSSAEVCPSAVHVQVSYPGASVEEVEHAVTLPLEDAVAGLEGLVRLESRSGVGEAMLRLEFSTPTDAEVVRAHLAAQLGDTLPSDTEAPMVLAVSDSRFARTPIEVRGEPSATLEVLRRLQDEGVEARIIGARSQLIRVHTDPEQLARVGLTRHQVRAGIAAVPRPQTILLGEASDAVSDPVGVLADIRLGLVGDGSLRLQDVATIELAVAPTPTVLDAGGELGLIAASKELPAAVASLFPDHIQLNSGTPISAPRCHRESLEGLAGVVAVRVHPTDVVAAAERLLVEFAELDADVVALVGISEGFGLDLSSTDADLHLLFPTAAPQAVVERLRALPEVEPLRVWGPPSTRVAVSGGEAEQREVAVRALRGALEDAGFFALTAEGATEPQVSFSLRGSASARLGLTAADLSRQVRSQVTAEPLTLMRLRGVNVPVVLDAASDGSDPLELANLQLQTPEGGSVPLSAVATIELGQSPAHRWRVDRRPARELQTNGPGTAVLGAWAQLASEHPGIELVAD